MSVFLYLLTYAAVIVFLAAIVTRMVRYIKAPMHVRWEIYPVPHEASRAAHGGGYLEEVDWWSKSREHSWWGTLKVMVPEILLLKAVWEHNRSLWYRTYPFHLGLYLTAGFIGLLLLGAVAQLAGVDMTSAAAVPATLRTLTLIVGPLGFALCIAGGIALIERRMNDATLHNYSAPSHYFNLAIFIVTMLVALATWLFVDPDFSRARGFIASLISFRFAALTEPLFMLQIFLAVLVLAYIPLTHMSHFFMKYFLYHDIRWGDNPNVDNPATQRRIGVVLNYPVSWQAAHIAIPGKKTWADIATYNPAADADAGKE